MTFEILHPYTSRNTVLIIIDAPAEINAPVSFQVIMLYCHQSLVFFMSFTKGGGEVEERATGMPLLKQRTCS